MPNARWSKARADVAIEAFRKGHSIRAAAGLARVDESTVRYWIEHRPVFRDDVRAAQAAFLEEIRAVVIDAATVDKDPRLAMAILRAKDPTWSDTVRHEVSGTGGGPVVHEVKIRWPAGATPPSERS